MKTLILRIGNVFLTIVTMLLVAVKVVVSLAFMVLLVGILVKFFTPWREALYDLSEEESRRQINSVRAKEAGTVPDAKCMIGDSVVITWLPRDFEGNERAFYKAFVSVSTPLKSNQSSKLKSVYVRLSEDAYWTDISSLGEYEVCTNDCLVTEYHEFRLPKRFDPQEEVNAHVRVVVSANENSEGDGAGRRYSKTFSYVFFPNISSGWCGLWHWLTNL